MQSILLITAKIFFIGLLGYIIRKKDKVSRAFTEGMNSLLVLLIAPCSILSSGNHEFSQDIAKNLLYVALIMAGYYAFTISVLHFILKKIQASPTQKSAFTNLVVFPNVGFIGFPIIGELFGDEGTLYVVVSTLLYNLLIFSFGVFNTSRHSKTGSQIDLKHMLKSPLVIASLLGTALFLSPVRVPEPAMDMVSSIGGMLAPISILIIGFQLAEYPLLKIFKNGYAYLVSVCRLLILPLLALLILYLLDISGIFAAVAVLSIALPSGTMNVILSKQYNCEPEFSTQSVVQGNLFMTITLPFIMMLVTRILI